MSFLCISWIHVELWGVNGGWTPLPTHLKRFCDTASLVEYVSVLGRDLVRNNIVNPRHLFFLFFQEFNYFSSLFFSFFSFFFLIQLNLTVAYFKGQVKIMLDTNVYIIVNMQITKKNT